ncbi:MAG TPA: DUF5686 and carboxypeptidase regulatory-like domain-containing protein [Phnomibacter sp.]|nr:DUF5686 and carboxypeptidase regulatory-like domain-containing protein [Phnomibacter sp.]
MMFAPLRFFLLVGLIMLAGFAANAQAQLHGKVTNQFGAILPYASVYVKGNTKGTVANAEGLYSIDLAPGIYTVVCAYVGYQKVERKIELGSKPLEYNFQLNFQYTELSAVVVKANAEDPAYNIIRQAIKKREEYLNEVKQWQVMVYMKGLIRTIKVPNSFMGVKVRPNRDVIDSSGKGIVYFSESLTKYFRRLPNDFKEEVVSAKVSGNSSGFGFNSPQDLEINLYENNIRIEGLNSRGFVSPIADNALNFYKYKYEGSYFEDGREVLRVKVMPKRKYEPLFAGGFIEIMDGTWRLHGVHLGLNKESQIELVDSLLVRQQMFPVNQHVWMPQNTEMTATFGFFGFRASAHFVGVYSDYEFDFDEQKAFGTRVIKKIDTAANKKSPAYWDSIRPSPLTAEERLDYLKKDTLARKMNDPHYLDSLDKISNRFGVFKFFFRGTRYLDRKQKLVFNVPPVALGIQYNTVEQWAYQIMPSFRKYSDTGAFVINARFRYGFGNRHFNASASFNKSVGRDYRKRWDLSFAGGKNVFQINPTEPIQPLNNSIATLLYTVNYMKIYEKAYGAAWARRTLNNGLRIGIGLSYEDRRPLQNSDTSYMWRRYKNRSFTSNYPEELPPGYFERHKALISNFTMRWQPGVKFLEYPDRRYMVESDMPVFNLTLTKAWGNLFGTDAEFGKWLVSVEDRLNMKLAGSLNYAAELGGFVNNTNVQLPDWRHFMGNQTVIASPFMKSFQLAPYYANSTREHFFATANIEWHLNGMLTNKIPLFRKLNWNLVTGSNAYIVDVNRNYVEIFFGLENIFKTFRVDWVAGYDGFNKKPTTGVVIGMSGLFTGQGVE